MRLHFFLDAKETGDAWKNIDCLQLLNNETQTGLLSEIGKDLLM